MLVKCLIALCILIAVMSIGYRGTDSVNKALNNKDLETRATILDSAIISYYCNHHGTLPASLDSNTLKVMGLSDIDLTNITYTKNSDRRFTLTAKLSTGNLNSANSGKDLIVPPEVN